MCAVASDGEGDRFYFRAVGDTLFVFDGARDTAHLLNAAAGRLFLCLTDQFVPPGLLLQAADLAADGDWQACLAQWHGFGWIEADAAGCLRLRAEDAAGGDEPAEPQAKPIQDPSASIGRDAHPALEAHPAGLPEANSFVQASAPQLLEQRRVRLAGRACEARLWCEGAVDAAANPPELDLRLAQARRMFGFLSGFTDPTPSDGAPEAVLDLAVARSGFTLTCGARRLSTPQEAVAAGKMRLWLLDLAYGAPAPAILLHAAALARPEGAVVLAGVSGAGKSTLSAALVAHGWMFGTDDSLALGFAGREGVVLPCPGAISLKPGSRAPLAGLYPDLAGLPQVGAGAKRGCYLPIPQERHLPAGGPEARVRCFVFPKFQAGAPTRVEPLDADAALRALMDAEFDLAEATGDTELDAFLDLLEDRPRYAITYGDMADMDATLRRLLAHAAAR